MSTTSAKRDDYCGGDSGDNIEDSGNADHSKCSLENSESEDLSDSEPVSSKGNQSDSDTTREAYRLEGAAKAGEASKKDKERRLAMNRDAARARRKRKRELIENLQESVGKLTKENNDLKQANKLLLTKIDQFSGLMRTELGSRMQLPFPLGIASQPSISQPLVSANLLPVSSGRQIPVLPPSLVESALSLHLQRQQDQRLNPVMNLGLARAHTGAAAEANTGVGEFSIAGTKSSEDKKKAPK